MCGIIKGTVKAGLVLALIGGVAVAVVGPHRVSALAVDVRDSLRDSIDDRISDTAALKTKLERLESNYPKQIAQTESDLEEVSQQIAQVRHEIAVSEGVVELVNRDLEVFENVLTEATSDRRESPFGIVRVRLGEDYMTTTEARAKATRLVKLRDLHNSNASQLVGHLNKLEAQEYRLSEHLAQLTAEHDELVAQIDLIERQIESYERNERLLASMEEREERLDNFDRYDASSIEDFRKHMQQLESEQDRRFESLSGDALTRDYEDRARLGLEIEDASVEPTPLLSGSGS